MKENFTIRFIEPKDFRELYAIQHEHHFHDRSACYPLDTWAFICKYLTDSIVLLLDDEIVGYRIAIMNWNNGYLNAMDVVVKKRGHNGMNIMMDFIEKQNYPRWICGVREDNVISQRKILQWKSKEGKGYEYTPWNDGTYRSGHKRLAMEADFWGEMFDKIRRGGRVVECTGLENQHTSDRIEGSNPSLSASRHITITEHKEKGNERN